MNKLITSLACGTLLSMSLMGVGFAESAAGTMGNTVPDTGARGGQGVVNNLTNDAHRMYNEGTGRLNQAGNNMMNQVTGTGNRTDNIMRDKVRTGDNNNGVSPLSTTNDNGRYRTNNTTDNGRYRANATTNNNDNDNGNWGWLGLIGLLGLAGMRNRSVDRERH
ncbi:WGxxGxxG family protein [Paenibacillus tepidiphilus]|uniref:WGxxGxxG family protein n=1 Tax=Paenibacillus tepidiphilus TaxID=2608683 RepID=UPI00123B463D|nr:WGxxGxxG family protein [Paenibacillus tepidiphilus]